MSKCNRREMLQSACAAGAALVGPAAVSLGAEAPTQSREWFGGPIWPPLERVEAVLQRWAKKYPDRMKLDAAGRSGKGRTIWAIRLTDPGADAAGKQHALITCLHSGLERSGSTGVLALVEWLVSDDPRAKEILRRQQVVCLPIPDPDRYVQGHVSPVYTAWTIDGPRDPQKSPEAMAVKRIMDELQPEVHADLHGTNMDFARYIMFESSATSYSNTALRPYQRDIIRQMDEAALAEGYPSDMAESDAQRLFWGPGVDPLRGKMWVGRPQVYAAIYCYYRYHTIVAASEVLWEPSAVARHRRLLAIGNEVWPGEREACYPTGIVMANTHAMVAAYGRTAAERRRSRVELWSKLPLLTMGMIDPVVEGKAVCACAVTPAAAKKWLSGPTLAGVVERLREHPRMNADAIARFTANWPGSQNAPTAALALQAGSDAKPLEAGARIEHGLRLRLRIPYAKAELVDLRLNGHPLGGSPTDGFVRWTARGCTYIEVNVAPERLKSDDLFFVTCQYDPRENRAHWNTWRE